jgi:CMP-N-acetylneuraminic acid synthetase
MNLIIEDDIKAISAENYLMTHTTNPLIAARTFEDALSEFQKLDKEEFNSLFSVNAYQSRFYTASANPVNHDPNNLIRTQDLPPLFEENSCIYLFNKESFYSTNARIGSKPKLFATPFFESVDIDDEKSWALAELYFDYLMSQKS